MRFKILLSLILSQLFWVDSSSAMFRGPMGDALGAATKVVRSTVRRSSYTYPEYVEKGFLCPAYCKDKCLAPKVMDCALLPAEDRLKLRMLEEEAKRSQWRAEARAARKKGTHTMLVWAAGTAAALTFIEVAGDIISPERPTKAK